MKNEREMLIFCLIHPPIVILSADPTNTPRRFATLLTRNEHHSPRDPRFHPYPDVNQYCRCINIMRSRAYLIESAPSKAWPGLTTFTPFLFRTSTTPLHFEERSASVNPSTPLCSSTVGDGIVSPPSGAFALRIFSRTDSTGSLKTKAGTFC